MHYLLVSDFNLPKLQRQTVSGNYLDFLNLLLKQFMTCFKELMLMLVNLLIDWLH